MIEPSGGWAAVPSLACSRSTSISSPGACDDDHRCHLPDRFYNLQRALLGTREIAMTNWSHPYWIIAAIAIGIPTIWFFEPVVRGILWWSFG
jgi:hypothetical protein